jgi:hypothetical protein
MRVTLKLVANMKRNTAYILNITVLFFVRFNPKLVRSRVQDASNKTLPMLIFVEARRLYGLGYL